MTASWKDIVDTIALLVAAGGLCATAIQLHTTRRFHRQDAARALEFQRENTAKSIYRDYLQMAVAEPILANGDIDEIRKLDLYAKYQWFVSYLLWACEEIIHFVPWDSEWKNDVT